MAVNPENYDTMLARLPVEQGAHVRRIAEQQGRPLSWVLRDLIWLGLEQIDDAIALPPEVAKYYDREDNQSGQLD